MKRFYQHILIAASLSGLLITGLSGCGTGEPPSAPGGTVSAMVSQVDTTGVLYSNLTDDASRKETADLLQAHGISKEQTDTLLEWAEHLNIRTQSPLPQGFVPMQGAAVSYQDFMFQPQQLDDGSYYPEENCRLTAFLLIKRHLQTGGQGDEQDPYLMFDIEEIDTLDQFRLPDQDRMNFITLYNAVSIEGATTQQEHEQKLVQAWQERGIQVDSSTGLSLVCLYLHAAPDPVRIVGHVGVLVEDGETLFFVEKYGPEGPFQATKFQNRDQLKQFLLARPDAYGDGSELPPIVTVNGAVL